MRSVVVMLTMCLGLAVLGGCASNNVAVSTPPTTDELPDLSQLERTLPIRVDVEGRSPAESRARLVPEIKEPELTAEEQEILGEQEIVLDQLPYALPGNPLETHVAPWYNDLRTGAYGLGGSDVGLVAPTRQFGVAGWGGVSYFTHGAGGADTAVHGGAGATVGRYGAAGTNVGYGRSRHVAKPYDPGN